MKYVRRTVSGVSAVLRVISCVIDDLKWRALPADAKKQKIETVVREAFAKLDASKTQGGT